MCVVARRIYHILDVTPLLSDVLVTIPVGTYIDATTGGRQEEVNTDRGDGWH